MEMPYDRLNGKIRGVKMHLTDVFSHLYIARVAVEDLAVSHLFLSWVLSSRKSSSVYAQICCLHVVHVIVSLLFWNKVAITSC